MTRLQAEQTKELFQIQTGARDAALPQSAGLDLGSTQPPI